MPIEVKMAKLSPTMESGQLVKWLVKVGDAVHEGDTLAEVQTDKAVMPMESFDEGTVAKLDVNEGDEVALGQRVLLLAKKGEDPRQVAEAAGPGGNAQPSVAVRGQSDAQEQTNTPNRPGAAAAPRGEATQPTPPPIPAPGPPSGNGHGNGAPAAGGRVKSTPLARKVAKSAGVEIGEVPGSGPGGRVVRADVDAYLQNRKAAPAAARPAAAAGRQTERIPHSRMRKTIAQRMVQAKQAPEIHVSVDIRLDAIMAAREALNAQLAREKVKLSVGDFITKGVALALRHHPDLNASYEEDAIVRHGEVNVGIAVALEGGLIVPVLPGADAMGLREIREKTAALAEAARSNKLTPQQMMGSTFTISNLGMYGVKHFDAILNLPEVGILAVGAGEKRPVVEGDALVVGTVMTVTLTADHRAVDGATAAEFLRTLKGFLENPATMLL